jgi:hypothetical protein
VCTGCASVVASAGTRDDLGLQHRLVAVVVFLPLALHPCNRAADSQKALV